MFIVLPSFDISTVIGLLAGTLTTIAFVPQLLHAWRSQSTKDVSLSMLTVFCSGVFLWLIYGVMTQTWPVIIANVVTLILAGMILLLKLKHG
jgi:MtN3 and saliva related transmembrane protein